MQTTRIFFIPAHYRIRITDRYKANIPIRYAIYTNDQDAKTLIPNAVSTNPVTKTTTHSTAITKMANNIFEIVFDDDAILE